MTLLAVYDLSRQGSPMLMLGTDPQALAQWATPGAPPGSWVYEPERGFYHHLPLVIARARTLDGAEGLTRETLMAARVRGALPGKDGSGHGDVGEEEWEQAHVQTTREEAMLAAAGPAEDSTYMPAFVLDPDEWGF